MRQYWFLSPYLKEKKWYGFNQNKEIAKELSRILEIPLLKMQSESINTKTVILVSDVYRAGETMQEESLDLKKAGVKEIWRMAAARE